MQNSHVHARQIDTQIPDLPPASFDETHFNSIPSFDLPPQEAAPVFRTPVKIARAISGLNEIRLLRQTQKGTPDVFVLEEANLQRPYMPEEVVLTRKNKGKPLTMEQSVKAFEVRVASKYPAERLRNNRLVAIHLNLL